MTTITIKQKLHDYINSAADRKLKAIYTMLEDEIESKSLLNDKQKKELDKRLDAYLDGNEATTSWKAAISKIKAK